MSTLGDTVSGVVEFHQRPTCRYRLAYQDNGCKTVQSQTCNYIASSSRGLIAVQTGSLLDIFIRLFLDVSECYDGRPDRFQRDLLYVITGLENGTPPHGLAIKDSLEEDYAGEIHHGRLYPNLDTLADMGLIDVSAIDKRTNAYSITQRGRRELEARREWKRQHVDLSDD